MLAPIFKTPGASFAHWGRGSWKDAVEAATGSEAAHDSTARVNSSVRQVCHLKLNFLYSLGFGNIQSIYFYRVLYK